MFGWSLKCHKAPYAREYAVHPMVRSDSSWLLQDACLDNGFWKIGQVDTDFWTGRLQPEYIGDLNQWDTTEVVDDRNTFPMFPFLCLGLFLFWKPGNMKFFTNLPTPSLVKCPSLQVLRPTNSFLTSQLCISNFTTYVACCDLGKYYSNPGSSLALGWLTTRNMLHQHGGVFWITCAAGSSLARRWNRVWPEKDGVTRAIEATVVSDKGMSTYHSFFPTWWLSRSSSRNLWCSSLPCCFLPRLSSASSCNYIPYWMP